MSQTITNEPFSWRGYEPASLPGVPNWVEPMGRVGYAAKGIVYAVLGVLAFRMTAPGSQDAPSSREAIREIASQPFGAVLMVAMAVGLFSYAAWRFGQAIKDTEGAGTGGKGCVKRTGYAISGLVYAALGAFAVSILMGSDNGSGGSSRDQATSTMLSSTGGRIALGIVAAIVIGVALHFFYKAYHAKFMSKYRLRRMSDKVRTVALHAGRMGISTRGIAFLIIGGFLMTSVVGGGNGNVNSMSDAMNIIAGAPWGKFLIGTAAFGLVAYAVHMFLMAMYRRFEIAE